MRGLTFVLGSMKKGKTLWCLFPSGFIWLQLCCGESVLVVCVSPVSSPGSRYCMLVRHLFGLFGRLTDVSVGCFFSSFNWKCSHLLQPNVYGKNKWKKKRRENNFGLLSVFTILCGIFVRIGWRWELFGQSCCFAAPKIMKPLNISGSTDREGANRCQWVWLLKEYRPLVENCNKWLIQ